MLELGSLNYLTDIQFREIRYRTIICNQNTPLQMMLILISIIIVPFRHLTMILADHHQRYFHPIVFCQTPIDQLENIQIVHQALIVLHQILLLIEVTVSLDLLLYHHLNMIELGRYLHFVPLII